MNKMLLALLLAVGAGPGLAQAPPPSASSAKEMSEAEIRKFDKDAKKITLKHGPIKNLDMPGMTMVFQVREPALLDQLAQMAVGDRILFSAELLQGAYIVTHVSKPPAK